MYWLMTAFSVRIPPSSSPSVGTWPFGLISEKSAPDSVRFALMSTLSSSNGSPVSRRTMCGASEQAPGA
jgi:hypothetical protein